MQQSNTYIIIFTALMTIFFGFILSITRMKLEPIQDIQVEIDTKKKILGAVMEISSLSPEEILSTYNKKMKSVVVNIKGEIIDSFVAEEVNVQKNFKVNPEDRQYPVFMYSNSGESIDAYIFPMFGNGLWDWISGFVALDNNLNRVIGVSFDHKTETPGLGARISSSEIQDRYKGKEIYDDDGKLVSIFMLRRENNDNLSKHEVDGMSGATITGKGLNNMLTHYFDCYRAFIEEKKLENTLKVSYE